MIRQLLAVGCAAALTIGVCGAQSSSTTSSTTTDSTGTTSSTTTTTEASGTITEYSPGSTIVLNTGSGEPTHYRFSKTVTYETPDGQVIEASKVKKNSKVRVHYVREGSDMLVDKVIVTE